MQFSENPEGRINDEFYHTKLADNGRTVWMIK